MNKLGTLLSVSRARKSTCRSDIRRKSCVQITLTLRGGKLSAKQLTYMRPVDVTLQQYIARVYVWIPRQLSLWAVTTRDPLTLGKLDHQGSQLNKSRKTSGFYSLQGSYPWLPSWCPTGPGNSSSDLRCVYF